MLVHRRWSWCVWLLLVSPAMAQWPQFRGPEGQGHATAKGLPLEWSETKNVAWKTPLPGKGWSSPVIDGDQVWMTTATDEGRSLRALCVNLNSGKLVHDVEVFHVEKPLPINAKNSHASPTAILEAGRVYVHFGTNGTACLDAQTAKILWTNTTLKLDHKEGPGSTPALYGDSLFITCDGMDVQYVSRLEKSQRGNRLEGEPLGPVDPNPERRKGYSTPLVIQVKGQDLLVSPGPDRVIAYDPLTGTEIWKVRYAGFSNVPRPVFDLGLVFVCTGYMKPQLYAINPESQGDVTESNIAWKFTKQAPANPSPLVVGNELYFVADSGVATCLDAKSGELIWTERLGDTYWASPIHADGRIYFFSEQGKTTVIKPGKTFESLAANRLDGRFMASPAVAGRALILRTDGHLYRIEQQP